MVPFRSLLFIYVGLQAADLVSTVYGMAVGVVAEGNPLAPVPLSFLGVSLKIAVTAITVACFSLVHKKSVRAKSHLSLRLLENGLLALIGWFSFVTANNFWVLLMH